MKNISEEQIKLGAGEIHSYSSNNAFLQYCDSLAGDKKTAPLKLS